MPREIFSAPGILPLFSTSGASRTSSTSAPFPIISFAWAGEIFGTAALAASSICFTEMANDVSFGFAVVRAPLTGIVLHRVTRSDEDAGENIHGCDGE